MGIFMIPPPTVLRTMKTFMPKFIRVCPRTGKIRGISLTGMSRVFLPIAGMLALLWILFRVATKPSRITYPCVRAAMPLATGFLGELVVGSIAAFAVLKSRTIFLCSPAFLLGAFLVAGLGGATWIESSQGSDEPVYANAVMVANNPVGVAKGIFPGRVVWVHDSSATNQQCVPNAYPHGWFMPENSNQSAVDAMVSSAIRELTGTTSDATAWDSIFVYHNRAVGRGSVGYLTGEKVLIKTNATSSWSGNYSVSDLSVTNNSFYGISETSPAIVLAVLRQLVQKAGVPQSDIYVGDPLRHIYKHCYDLWHGEFPAVHYLDHNSNFSGLGREQAILGLTAKVYYSDNDSVLVDLLQGGIPVHSDALYQIFEDATYVLNIPMLKGHKYGGITMFAKNNFGSQSGRTNDGADHLHRGLMAPPGVPPRLGYGFYRVQVDLMGNRYLGEKCLFHLLDALWATDAELDPPKKWKLPPFNDTYMSSIFASFDPVAIECVGDDFLRSEFTTQRHAVDGTETFVQMPGTDDYLRQAADTTAWPAGVHYAPDGNGMHLTSLGVYEHWNDSLAKQYSRNLGTGDGIELVQANPVTGVEIAPRAIAAGYSLDACYPNPFNPATTIEYTIGGVAALSGAHLSGVEGRASSDVRLVVYDVLGREVAVLVNEPKMPGSYEVKFNGAGLSSGVYIYRMTAGAFSHTRKMILMK